MTGLGELAAFGTAAGWAISSYVHGVVGHMVGAQSVVLLRMPYQVVLLTALCVILGVEASLDPGDVLYLFLSGVTGVTVCDLMFYGSINIIGPQAAVLLLSLSSGFTALLGFYFLDERLSGQTVAGIALASLGVFWVLAERTDSLLLPGQEIPRGRRLAKGVLWGIGAALTQAFSFVFLKLALRGGMSPLWAALLRLGLGAALLWGMGMFTGWSRSAVGCVRIQPKVFWLLLGVCVFSASGMWLSSVAISLIPAGVAGTLINLQPVLVVLIGALWRRSLPSGRAVCGTLIAFCGTALVCL